MGYRDTFVFWLAPQLSLAAIAAIFPANSVAALDSPNVVQIIDAVPSLRPAEYSKSINISSDTKFAPGTSCELSYKVDGGVVSSNWNILLTKQEGRNSFRSASAADGDWNSDPSLCSKSTRISHGHDWIGLEAPGPTGVAESLVLYQDHIHEGLRSVEHWSKYFGVPKYPASNKVRFPNQHLNWFVPWTPITDYSELRLVFDARLDHAQLNFKPLQGAPTKNSAEAQADYDPKLHATRYRVEPVLQWRDPRCRKKIEGDPICQYQGRSWAIKFEAYDERIDIEETVGWSRPIPISSPGVNWVYKLGLRPLLPKSALHNPFKEVGVRAVARGDILPFIRQAVRESEARQDQEIMPPRLTRPDGSKESDEQYFNHFGIVSLNAGFEVSGLSDIAFDIYELSLKGLSANDAPHCILTAAPTTVAKGDTASLSWTGNNIVSGTINAGIGNMSSPSQGWKTTAPLAETTTFVATVQSADGEAQKCRATVVVHGQ